MADEGLLHEVRVVELSATPRDLPGEAVAMAGRVLADLGADVVAVVPASGDPLEEASPRSGTGSSLRAAAWRAGKAVVAEDQVDVSALLAGADVVLEAPVDEPRDRAAAPDAVWVTLTPYGSAGPRAGWRGSDLAVTAASGNLFVTGDPDRPPLRASEPSGYAHGAAEMVVAALSGLASGTPQHVDVSLQATVLMASFGGPARFPETGDRGSRRGPNIGRTREVWPCADGYVIFGMRGGPARARNWELLSDLLAREGLDTSAFTGRDWKQFDHNEATQEELDALAEPIADYFARHTMAELYELATETNLMLAPAADARQIVGNRQFLDRGLFAEVEGVGRMPWTFTAARSAADDLGQAPGARRAADGTPPSWDARERALVEVVRDPGAEGEPPPTQAWAGLRLLEFGSGAAGPLLTRYFIEHGAECVRIESTKRPDFLRLYYNTPGVPRLEGSPMFANLNVGKKSVTLNMKDPRGLELALKLVDRCDAVVENYAPKTMASWGLDYDTLAQRRPDLVMVSSCLFGNTGPHKDYPGFGSQGAALSGYTYLCGWPDREPVGPFGTITDSLAPRYAAAGLAAALLYRQRTGKGVYLDVSQVEAAIYTLAPWILEETELGGAHGPLGNRHPDAVPHGVFPAAGDDRWIALATWDDEAWARLAKLAGIDTDGLETRDERGARIDEVEERVAAWTSQHDGTELAERLQAEGIEAFPVLDFGDVLADPQLTARDQFVTLAHPLLGEHTYERCGFRMDATPGEFPAPGPTLGQHNEEVLGGLLGRSPEELRELADEGVLS